MLPNYLLNLLAKRINVAQGNEQFAKFGASTPTLIHCFAFYVYLGFAAGGCAAFASSFVAVPVDVVSQRLMLQESNDASKNRYKGTLGKIGFEKEFFSLFKMQYERLLKLMVFSGFGED
jgi:hypothetical protein